jgi:uncharacterized delta-60 repeat protein
MVRLNFISILLLVCLVHVSAFGQSLIQDPSFGNKGKILFANNRYNEVKDIVSSDNSFFVLIESGKIDSIKDLDIVVLKYSAQGKPDMKFGKKGQITFDFFGMDFSRASELKILSDGKILIAGDGARKDVPEVNLSCVIRINSNGSIDRTFGKEGTLAIAFDKASFLSAMDVQNDTSIYIAGNYLLPYGNHTDIFPVVGKLNLNGEPDRNFGKTGKIGIDFENGIFSFARNKHSAGGEIKDLLVLNDGKILICGGYLFQFTYEGFVAQLMPDGTLDKSFNATGYIRYNWTPGKFNEFTQLMLYDSKTVLFGARSQIDYDSDFYFGFLNLETAIFSTVKIDSKSQHETLEDMSLHKGRVILSGRTVRPENVGLHHRSDLAALAVINNIKDLNKYEMTTFSFSKENQHGIMRHTVLGDKIIAGGFVYTSEVLVKDVIITCFKFNK